MTQSRSDHTINVLRDKTRVVKAPPPSRRGFHLNVILHENSRLLIEGPCPALRLTYAGKKGGKAYVSLAKNATVWIESWHPPRHPATLHIEIGPGACAGINEHALALNPYSVFSVKYRSEGTGCLTAIWHAVRAGAPLQIAGMVAGDRLNLPRSGSEALCQGLTVPGLAFGPTAKRNSTAIEGTTNMMARENPCLEHIVGTDAVLPDLLPIGLAYDSWSHLEPDGALVQRMLALGQSTSPGKDPEQAMLKELFRARTAIAQWSGLAPVTFEANALGPGLPERRIELAPGQRLLYQGMAVSAHELTNGRLITQTETAHYACYVVPQALVERECNLAGLTLLPANSTRPMPPYFEMEQFRRQLLDYAASVSGMLLDNDPALRLEFNGVVIDAEPSAEATGIWRFVLPCALPHAALCIVSRSAIARDTSTLPLTDQRTLGIALHDLVVNDSVGRRHLDLFHPAWKGLHAGESRRGRELRWTNGLATLPAEAHGLHGGETIELHVAAVGRYWIDGALDDQEGAK